MLKGNKKVPAGYYVSNIPFIITKRKKTYIYLKSTLAKQILRSSPDNITESAFIILGKYATNSTF